MTHAYCLGPVRDISFRSKHVKDNINSDGASADIFSYISSKTQEGYDAFGLSDLMDFEKDGLKVALAQTQVNGLNHWMDKLRNVASYDSCRSILNSLPGGWYRPELAQLLSSIQ